MKYCPKCDDKFSDRVHFFENCGTQLEMFSVEIGHQMKRKKKKITKLKFASIIIVVTLFITSGVILYQKIQVKNSNEDNIVMKQMADYFNTTIYNESDRTKKYYFETTTKIGDKYKVESVIFNRIKYYRKFSSRKLNVKNAIVFDITSNYYIWDFMKNKMNFGIYDRYGNNCGDGFTIHYHEEEDTKELYVVLESEEDIRDCKFVIIEGLSENENDCNSSVIFKVE